MESNDRTPVPTQAAKSHDAEGLQEAPDAKQMLPASEQRFASFMNHLPGFAWIKDAAGKYVFVNKYTSALPNYATYEQYAGKTDFELWPHELAAEYRANDLKVIQTGLEIQRIESLLFNQQRRTLLSNKFPIFDGFGKVAFVGGVAFDITNQLEIEQELKQSHGQLRALTAKLQFAREEEARRIAREIHDELGQALAALNLDCAFLEKGVHKLHASATRSELAGRLGAMAGAIEQTVNTVRRICSELRPAVLDDLGLIAALECQTADFQARTNTRCTWLAKPDALQLSSTQATAIFRIFQEILTNVMRHAAATEVAIKLEVTPDRLCLEVSDNGKGISPGDLANPKSLGLLGMRERAFLVQGTLEIKPRSEGGTWVSLKVPLPS
jgi:PAS domain S-box-containing protein